ncbi:hypothetical protein [Pseudoxanthomonas winnipegensis]|uniref:Uncharacterized protein n=1 Tax=Pseudoxanthomonas winnipegensis TaxID=2480810 RepID=A0A4Q8M416_9GAMM|nr:hypothetical protein [Pseudoxanthomonas winnipegensis]TAA40850.1 hypothetical protein EA655_12695 [Pseudoxanthomonas winnipegensis]
MRYLCVQVQPGRAPDLDAAALIIAFQRLVVRIDLVRSHSFDHGYDDGAYYNFVFGTERPRELWRLIQDTIFLSPGFREELAASAMAMCSSESGWHKYSQLYHWDPDVPVVPLSVF